VQAALGPEQPGCRDRVGDLLGDADHVGQCPLRTPDRAAVDERVREEHGEAQLLDRRTSGVRLHRRGLEQRDRQLRRARRGIGTAERVDRSRVSECAFRAQAVRLFEALDRLLETAGAE
jgi:hypothetical protein